MLAASRSIAKRRPNQVRRHLASRPGAVRGTMLRRKVGGCACGGGCPHCGASARPAGRSLSAGVAGLETGGDALAASERDFFEPRFGRDLSAVKLHSDGRAAALAEDAGALAFTAGRHIVLGAEASRQDPTARRPLIAHELAHTIQQGSAPAAEAPAIQRFTAGQCRSSGCKPPTRCDTIQADFERAEDHLKDAIAALSAAKLSDFTKQAIRWYFHRDGDTSDGAIKRRLGLIKTLMLVTDLRGSFRCVTKKDCGSALAYVFTSTRAESMDFKPIQLCPGYFKKNPRQRAQILTHEAAHLVGMSVHTDDVYEESMRFRSLKADKAMLNADSYALFASAIDRGSIGVSLTLGLGARGGAVFSGLGSGWFATEYLDVGFQHPVLHIFNPTLRISATALGVPQSRGRTPSTSFAIGVLPGLRIENPRPSGANFNLSLFGGPALNIRSDLSGTKTALGAKAGIGVGFRWRWLGGGVGASYLRDPTAAPGARNLLQVGGQISFTLGAGSP